MAGRCAGLLFADRLALAAALVPAIPIRTGPVPLHKSGTNTLHCRTAVVGDRFEVTAGDFRSRGEHVAEFCSHLCRRAGGNFGGARTLPPVRLRAIERWQVNCAGRFNRHAAPPMPLEFVEAMLRQSVTGTFVASQAAAPLAEAAQRS